MSRLTDLENLEDSRALDDLELAELDWRRRMVSLQGTAVEVELLDRLVHCLEMAKRLRNSLLMNVEQVNFLAGRYEAVAAEIEAALREGS